MYTHTQNINKNNNSCGISLVIKRSCVVRIITLFMKVYNINILLFYNLSVIKRKRNLDNLGLRYTVTIIKTSKTYMPHQKYNS